MFNPAFRSQEMRARMSGGKPDSVILTYVGRLGAGVPCLFPVELTGLPVVIVTHMGRLRQVVTHWENALAAL